MTSQYEISGKTHICIVILTLICIFICCAFAGDSYQESKPGNKKRKSEALWKKLNNLKPLFNGNEEHCISKEVKGNALASKGKAMPTKNNNNRSKCVS